VITRRLRWTIVALGLVLLASCGSPPGRPRKGEEPLAPNEVLDFHALYAANCAGCHGRDGRGGAAIALADPVYLAIADDSAIRDVIAIGVRGTSMPAFAQSAGGMLADAQIDAIMRGIRKWRRPGLLDAANPPFYAAGSSGDARRGEAVFGTYCASCHGAHGEGGAKGSAIADESFLALVSDQGLRTVVNSGRPDLGAPDWRGNVPGRPMSDDEVTDVVAWLASRRVESPGRPYPASSDGPPRSASNDGLRQEKDDGR
jgi:mono/diheme cytochrome c family protein